MSWRMEIADWNPGGNMLSTVDSMWVSLATEFSMKRGSRR